MGMAARARALVIVTLIGAGAVLTGLWLYGVRPSPGEAANPPAPVRIASGQTASRIAILGTSLTARGDWVARLQDALRRCNSEVVVTPLAKPGANSSWGLATIAGQKAAFDIVIVEFSINDASLFHGMPLFLSHDRHAEILAGIRGNRAVPVLATMSPAWGREAWERPGQASYRQMYRDLAQRDDVALIDTAPDWSGLAGSARKELVPDNLHPTDAGMEKVALPAFLSALQPAVCGPRG